MQASGDAAGAPLPLVLLTGAAGSVGTILRTHWAQQQSGAPRFRLRLADLPNPTIRGGAETGGTSLSDTLAPHEEVVEFDCADYDAFVAACKGVHTVVHLAADPSPSADFYGSLLQRNIVGESLSSFASRVGNATVCCHRILSRAWP